MERDEDSAFGRLLRRHRIASNLSQEALAERARMSAVGIGALERGARRAPYRETVLLLADALALSGEERAEFVAAAKRKAGRARSGVHGPAKPPAAAALPVRLTSFVGREREVGEVAQLLRDGRLVTVTGIGGIGKTSVALQVGTVEAPRWAGEVWFVPLAALRDGSLVPSAIASALNLRLPAQGDPVYALCEALRERTALLILDNCEHVVADAAAVAAALLRACPGLKLIASSREPLSIGGEAAYRLPVLDVRDSVDLFVDRAAACDARFRLDERNAPVVAETCRRLEGIALAIELAAARVRLLGPAGLLERLDERFSLLTGGRRDAPSHQQTLRATMDWSYGLLDEREQAVLRTASIFAGGFDLHALVAVTGRVLSTSESLDVLQSLVDKSLVNVDVSTVQPRYSLLDSTRAYALELLDRAGEREACAGRHLEHYLGEFERAEAMLEATLSDDAIVALLPELENVRAALAWSLAGGDVERGVALAIASGRLWFVLGLMHERIAQLETFIAACGDDRLAARARLWTSLTYIAGDSLRAARAVEAAGEALTTARRAGDAVLLHHALVAYAFVAARRRDVSAAAAAFEEAQALSGFEPTPRERMRLTSTRGLIAAQRNDLDDAAAAHEEALAVATSLGNAHWRMVSMLNLAEIEHQRGRTQQAIRLAREAAPEAAKRLSPNAYVHLMNNLAGYLVAIDDLPAARASAQESLARLALADPKSGLSSIALEHLALIIALEGDAERAARVHGFCEAAYAAAGYVREYTERTSSERLTALLESRLGAREAAARRAAGATATLQQALEEATR